MSILAESLCKHCGNSCASGVEFCCKGCSAAYTLITGAGLDDFYKLLNHKKLKSFGKDVSHAIQVEFSEKQNNLPSANGLCQTSLYIENVTCNACSWLLEKIPLLNNNIKAVEYSPSLNQVKIQYASSYPLIEVAQFFYDLGYPVHLVNATIATVNKKNMRRFYVRTAIAFASMISTMHVSLSLLAGLLEGMDLSVARYLGITCFLLSLPAVLYSAIPFYKNTWLSLKTKQVHIDTLVSFTVFIGMSAGIFNIITGKNEFYFDAVTTLIAFILGARLFVKEMENRFYSKSNATILDLINSNFNFTKGQVVTVKSGETIPCDGIVISGTSFIDSAWLTGESHPTYATQGSLVYAGATNKGDLLTLEVTAAGADTRASKILALLKNTTKSKTQIQSEKAEKIFVGVTVIFILALSVLNLYFPLTSWSKIVALVIILCPCALGLAIPLTFSAAIKQALDKGIYFKNAQTLEAVDSVDTVVFDKTGTLTKNEFIIKRELWIENILVDLKMKKDDIRSILYTISTRSSHLLLRPFLNYSNFAKGLTSELDFKEHFSMGVELAINGNVFKLGNSTFVGIHKTAAADTSQASKLYLSINNTLLATFELEQRVDQSLWNSIKALLKSKILYILSGDSKAAVESVAANFGINPSHTYYQQTPESKLAFIDKLTEKNNVMMVGDGVNDLLAFKKSHVSVSFFDDTNNIINQSDIMIQKNAVHYLSQIFTAAKKVKSVVFINLAWAGLFNIAGIYVVLAGYIGPIASAILMPLSSVIVVLFSVKQRYFV